MKPKPLFYKPSKRRWIVLAAAVAVAVVAVVLLADRGGDEQSDIGSGPRTGSAEVPLQHVHGLGVNPVDGSLLAATHTGLFRLTGHGEPEAVGTSRQDLMGFTVVGPDHFLASGHPDVAGIRAGQPGHLGLIESRNGGGTWELVSLTGEADLHALAALDGRVYAADARSGRFLVTADLQRWEHRADLSATAIAVDPSNPDRLVVATGADLVQSLDGGATWKPLPGPKLVLVAWGADTDLWGVAADGATYRRNAPSGEWEPLDPLPGAPQAILGDGADRYAAIERDGRTEIYRSDGSGWDRLFRGA